MSESDRTLEYTETLFSEQGARHYRLDDDYVSITTRGREVVLALKDLEPNYDLVGLRSPAFRVGLVGAALALILAAVSFADVLEATTSQDLLVLSAVMAGISGLVLATSWRKIERAIFPCTAGGEALAISRAGPQSEHFDQFVDELAGKIRCAQGQAP